MLYFKEEGNFVEGAVFVVDKPLTWTSFDVVNRLKYAILHQLKDRKRIKIGHAGTLDPLATGVVVVCVGRYTKRIEEFQSGEKEYIAEIKFGATTPCFDKELPEDKYFPMEHITESLIAETLPNFMGEIVQEPPLYSALKIEGKRAYDLARAGKELRIKPRRVLVSDLQMLSYQSPYLKLHVTCGKGAYIRSLARDLGKELDSGAYLTALKRTRVGDFSLEKSSSIETCLQEIKKYH